MKTVTIGGKIHALIVLRILEWDEQGRPSKAIIGHPDTVFRLDDPNQPNEFLTAFVSQEMLEKQRKDH